MGRLKLSMPSPAMIVACLALVAALGGTAYAALGKNSVKSRQIAPKAVKASDLANAAVKGQKIKDGAVSAAKLAAGSVGGAAVADGAITTSKLAPFSVGLANLNLEVVSRYVDAPLPDDGTRASAFATCQPGEAIVGGGASFNFGGTTPPGPAVGGDLRILSSRPALSPAPGGFPADGSTFDGWRVTAINEAGGPTGAISVTSQAICLKARD